MIITNGIDIIDIRRIKKTIKKYGNRFKLRCFSLSEIERSEKKMRSAESYAKRYAAKEACAKALGTGLANAPAHASRLCFALSSDKRFQRRRLKNCMNRVLTIGFNMARFCRIGKVSMQPLCAVVAEI